MEHHWFVLEDPLGGKNNHLSPQLNSASQRMYDVQFRTPVVNTICGCLSGLLAEAKLMEIKTP